MSPLPLITRHLTKSDNLWGRKSDQFQFSDQLVAPLSPMQSSECWPVSDYLGDNFNIVTTLLSIVTILHGQAEFVQQVVRKKSAI